MFRFIGILLSFAACTVIGMYKSSEIRKRKTLLCEFQELLLHISTEMNYFKEPLPIIFERLLSDNDTLANQLLRQCYLKYQYTNGPANFQEIWSRAIETTYKDEPLKSEDLQLFHKCGSFLGQSDFESQKAHFSLLQGQLDKQIRDAEAEIKTKGSLYSKAGVSIGAVIAIALI